MNQGEDNSIYEGDTAVGNKVQRDDKSEEDDTLAELAQKKLLQRTNMQVINS